MPSKKISYRHKDATICPICSYEFHREDMLTGGGRLNVGKLTDELRRLYEKNQKFGKIYPLAYLISVCPRCLYSSYQKDFNNISKEELVKIRSTTDKRKHSINKFFGTIDFNLDRNLTLGAASFLLSVECYSFRNKNTAPTIKKAVSSIRAAWLFDDLFTEVQNKSFKKISNFFYKKAYIFYHQSLELLQKGEEHLEDGGNIGPDFDKNWGYDGILYLCSYLTLKIGSTEKNIKQKIENFERTKRFLSKLFGSGKTSKAKPGALIEKIRDLYDKINEMLDQWYQEIQ